MRIYNPATNKEVYMLDPKMWGGIAKTDVIAWVNYLTTGSPTGGVVAAGVCQFDKDNLS